MPTHPVSRWEFPAGRPWRACRTNPEYVRYLAETAGVTPITAQVLVGRGVKTPPEILRFLNPQQESPPEPFELPDMDRAVERIRRAAADHEGVLVFGDYDADGLTATAICLTCFRQLGIDTDFMIPDRIREGYGLSEKALDRARRTGRTLIVTADCGTTAVQEVETARAAGIDLIITDHHSQSTELPDAVAVINPARPDSGISPPHLAGAGVALRLAEALLGPEEAASLVELAAIGTVADIVPLTGENRRLVHDGLRRLNISDRAGIRALRKVFGLEKNPLSSRDIGFSIGPRINAAGRMGDASPVIDLLTTDRVDRAEELARFLDENNRQRKAVNAEILQAIQSGLDPETESAVLARSDPSWHPGVLGIVASRLAEDLSRPVFLFNEREGTARGSGRSVPGFDLMPALNRCADLLDAYGGHRQAAGVTLAVDRLPEFRKRLSEIFNNAGGADAFPRVIRVDAEVRLSDLNFTVLEELRRLEPFGHRNEEPVFGVRSVTPVRPKRAGKNSLKTTVRRDGCYAGAIGFGMGDLLERLDGGNKPLDLLFHLRDNQWNGTRRLQLRLKALRPAS